MSCYDKKQCKNCRFWNFISVSGTTRGIANISKHECRRHAPIVAVLPQYGEEVTACPITRGDDWCGDFEISDESKPCSKCGKICGDGSVNTVLGLICKSCGIIALGLNT